MNKKFCPYGLLLAVVIAFCLLLAGCGMESVQGTYPAATPPVIPTMGYSTPVYADHDRDQVENPDWQSLGVIVPTPELQSPGVELEPLCEYAFVREDGFQMRLIMTRRDYDEYTSGDWKVQGYILWQVSGDSEGSGTLIRCNSAGDDCGSTGLWRDETMYATIQFDPDGETYWIQFGPGWNPNWISKSCE